MKEEADCMIGIQIEVNKKLCIIVYGLYLTKNKCFTYGVNKNDDNLGAFVEKWEGSLRCMLYG